VAMLHFELPEPRTTSEGVDAPAKRGRSPRLP
jgi:hypothetical protein